MFSFEARATACAVRLSSLAPRCVVAVLLALVFLPAAVMAAETEKGSPSDRPERTDPPSHAAGTRIYVDPETGQRTSRPSEAALRAGNAARPEFSQSSEGLVERPAPGGGVIVDLQGRFQSSSQVRIDAAGRREIFCNDPLHGVAAHAHAIPAPGPEER
ncbi:MAG TPA: hypothetical protein VND91_01640 [Candidatus Saccharimonadia bacterium]|nr:hypothetical protein [Candidatus Saccharimonadia bacterium]